MLAILRFFQFAFSDMAKRRKTSASNKKNLNVNMPVDLRSKLDELAARSGLKLSAYVRMVLGKAAGAKTTYRIQEISGKSAKKS